MVTQRDKKITDNIGLVHTIANRFKNRGVEYDDLFQAGCLGLVKAVDNFDESKGFAFSTYAVPVIMGEIKRLFRDGGAIKVSRALKEKSIKVQALRDEFVKKEEREPTIKELSDICQINVEELSEILNIINPVVSLNSYYDDENEELDIPYDESEKLFNKLSVDELMQKLSEEEKQLIQYRYYQGKTQCETAELIGVSQVQISRKEKAILKKLRGLHNSI
ncbi:MAG: sigma-70 family RNA polymerase sigma factor [Eubacterium sp.]|nr:sigma-70 family RNA polymerase sigma factor [Eubacterium sp.]